MEKIIVYDELQAQIPKGDFYLVGTIPYRGKKNSYEFNIDTLLPYSPVYIDFNGERYNLQTDASGIVQLVLFLKSGVNTLKWRLAGKEWNVVEISTSNIGAIHEGIGDAVNDILADLSEYWDNACISTALDLSHFHAISGIDVLTKERLEEAMQALYYFVDRKMGPYVLGGAMQSIPPIIYSVGSFVPNRNLVKDKLFSDIESNYILEPSNGVLEVVTGGLYDKALKYTGSGNVEIYVALHSYGGEYGNWLFSFYAKSNITPDIRIALSVDGSLWYYSDYMTLSDEFEKYTLFIKNSENPKYAKIEIGQMFLSNNWIEFSYMHIGRDRWSRTLPATVGSGGDKKHLAILSCI